MGELQEATRELCELARGIHPAALGEGLDAGVQSLAARSPIPTEIDLPTCFVPDRVALTAYYVVAEALTNAARHSAATLVTVRGQVDDGVLRLDVRDDGRGGASMKAGSGLAGLRDRVEAMHGRLHVVSPRGAGTAVEMTLPCGY